MGGNWICGFPSGVLLKWGVIDFHAHGLDAFTLYEGCLSWLKGNSLSDCLTAERH